MRLATCAVRVGALAIALGIVAAVGGVGVASADTGTVKWWDDRKGFGFITPDKGGNAVPVQRYDVIAGSDGGENLWKGDKVIYDVAKYDKKTKKKQATAINVRPAAFG